MPTHLRMRTILILWTALLLSIGIYAAILIIPLMPLPQTPQNPIMLYAIAPVALIVAVVSFILPAQMYRQAALRNAPKTIEQSIQDDSFSAAYRNAPPTQTKKYFADTKAAQQSAFAVFMTPFILRLALSESIALFGFTLGFLGFPALHVAPFFILSVILFILRFPTQNAVFRPFEEAHQASFQPPTS